MLRKIYFIILSTILFFNCLVNKDKKKQDELLLLIYLLNQPEPLTIECVDLPANQVSTSINTNTENCSNISDPLYAIQWHFSKINFGITWQSYCGSNVKVGIIDDGLEISHEDISSNVELNKSYDYYDGDNDPTGNLSSDDSIHGTPVAGLIAAKDNNLGVRGIAPRASIRAYNAIKTGTITDIVDATIRDISNIWISNNSWGPTDKTGFLIPADSLWESSINNGLKNGRFGLGTIYLFAAGNGAIFSYNGTDFLADNSNYDGYANYNGVISICAVGDDDKKATYSEKGANLWICAPSMGDNLNGLVTTDLSGTYGLNSKYYSSDLTNNYYTKFFNGTSGSTPIVSGVVALMLQAKPYLSWRDVRYILAKSAKKNDSTDNDWTRNAANFNINHKYGFGLVDVTSAVNVAKNWTNLGGYRKCTIKNIPVYKDIVDNGPAVTNEFNTAFSEIKYIEWVDAHVHLNHSYWGDLLIQLYSPSGTKAILMEPHNCSNGGNGRSIERIGCQTGNMDWRFGIARFLDETAIGNFRIHVQDLSSSDAGFFKKWDLTIYGRTQ